MSRPRVLIPLFPGTNCHEELAEAFTLAGGNPRVVPIHDLFSCRVRLSETDLLAWAGGFSYGDHIRSGAFAASDLLTRLADEFARALQKRIPMIGICNGFQILVETGVLPGNGELGKPTAVLDRNKNARFVHRSETVVYFHNPHNRCLWLTGFHGAPITLPVAHGEGRLVPERSDGYRVAATYGTFEGDAEYSPNGSSIAGICTPTILGLMPHPERRICKLRGGDQGLAIFQAGVKAVS